MGADGAFERRREELRIIRGMKKLEDISEEDVFNSYKDEVDPAKENNFMLQYLEQAQLVYTFGDVVFVHGAITKDNLGTIPGKDERVADVSEWEKGLNDWMQCEIEAFKKNPNDGLNRYLAAFNTSFHLMRSVSRGKADGGKPLEERGA